jgi:hypothetical protein
MCSTELCFDAQTDPLTYTASYQSGIGGMLSEIRRPELEAEHSPSSNADFKNSCLRSGSFSYYARHALL